METKGGLKTRRVIFVVGKSRRELTFGVKLESLPQSGSSIVQECDYSDTQSNDDGYKN